MSLEISDDVKLMPVGSLSAIMQEHGVGFEAGREILEERLLSYRAAAALAINTSTQALHEMSPHQLRERLDATNPANN